MPQDYSSFLSRSRFYEDGKPWVSLEVSGHLLVEEFLNLPLEALGGKTALQAAEDPQMLDLLTATV
ncbi:MAG TPA: hypothetical protein DCF63_10965 [Planctomycetaceae bacterium]|nr:hypothetical protein [Planctomycetaceae bacterium]